MRMRILLAVAAALGLGGCNNFGCMGWPGGGGEGDARGACTLHTTFFASAQVAPRAQAALETKS